MLAEELAVARVGIEVDRARRGGLHPLSEHADPTPLVPTGQADEEPALEHVVDHRAALGEPDRVVRGEHEPELPVPQPPRAATEVEVVEPRVRRELKALGVEVVLGVREPPVAEVVQRHREPLEARQHLLIGLVVAPQGAAVQVRRGIAYRRVDLDDDLRVRHACAGRPAAFPLEDLVARGARAATATAGSGDTLELTVTQFGLRLGGIATMYVAVSPRPWMCQSPGCALASSITDTW